jgi:hypothetical protein
MWTIQAHVVLDETQTGRFRPETEYRHEFGPTPSHHDPTGHDGHRAASANPSVEAEAQGAHHGACRRSVVAQSRNLSTELPALLAVLAVRLGRTERVSYNVTAWDTAPRRITVDGRRRQV